MDVKIVDHEEQCFNINRAIRSYIIENHKQLKEDVGSKGLQYIWMKEPSCGIHILITMCRIPLRTENSMQRQSSGKEMLKNSSFKCAKRSFALCHVWFCLFM